jgi:hypothetical protein
MFIIQVCTNIDYLLGIVIVSKIIIFCDKSNTDDKTVYTLYFIPRFM